MQVQTRTLVHSIKRNHEVHMAPQDLPFFGIFVHLPEAEVLAEMEIHSADDMIEAAKKISDTYHCAVLCKGGHKLNDANDLLYRDGGYRWFNGKRIDNPNTHGTGCTLSSAIASNLARGFSLEDSVRRSKQYLTDALKTQLDLGHGSGPLDHTLGKTQ